MTVHTLEQIETKITFLERVNAELSESPGGRIEAVHIRVSMDLRLHEAANGGCARCSLLN